MVSFWPFKSSGDAASFERTLSDLTGKITRAAARNDGLRQKSRRVRVMWTLYVGFAYILAALLLTLVTGWRNWGPIEITIVAGGPVLIYGTRTLMTSYYDYRISNTDAYIKKLIKERDTTIERLKEATKYNSTQQLLEKYGSSPKPKQAPPSPSQQKAKGPQKPTHAPGPRTGMAPPPTANIQRPSNQRPSTPQRPVPVSPQQAPSPQPVPSPQEVSGAEFAPNAFSPAELTRQYTASTAATFTQSHWYDRILDALLGEDETQPKNRLALICSECRLVNGQAPPGARSLEDVGRWRCGGCHAWNGHEKPNEDAIVEIVQSWEAERKAKEKERAFIGSTNAMSGDDQSDSVDEPERSEGSGVDVAEEVMEDSPPSRSTRSKSKSKK
ncbi:hypothetical protein CC80DRAFT_405622 [Byssothecium circinans]|uniref:Endoplasmic reticulum junction formation protein lunapark n=1 Tax=Byssothecium circinans TaxID=147558 RepID=A0A6A5U9Y1_9PLEO|nr:hypothetical protein CC80DRAFT_405622 [Byssothecium circinans]